MVDIDGEVVVAHPFGRYALEETGFLVVSDVDAAKEGDRLSGLESAHLLLGERRPAGGGYLLVSHSEYLII